MSRAGGPLFLGIGGHVVAIDAATGEEMWRTRLKAATFTSVWSDGTRVYAGALGEIFCLDAATGHVLWHNPLKGLGRGIVAFPCGGGEAAAALAAAQAQAAAAG